MHFPAPQPAATVAAGPSSSQSLRAAYGAWALEYADISGPYLARALRAWGRIKAWLKDNSPEVRVVDIMLAPAATHTCAEAQTHTDSQFICCIFKCTAGC